MTLNTILLWLAVPVTALFVLAFRFAARHDRRREKEKLHHLVEEAREKILADGKVEGPKGPYVPHKKWNVGTPSETRPASAKSYHGGPWPE
jgi:hypothetical protein